MPKQVTNKDKTVGITIRVDVETNRMLSAILSLKGMTLSGFLLDSIHRFIRDNYQEAKDLFDISRMPWISAPQPEQARGSEEWACN